MGVFFHALQAQGDPAKVGSGHRLTPGITAYLTIIGARDESCDGVFQRASFGSSASANAMWLPSGSVIITVLTLSLDVLLLVSMCRLSR